MLTEHMFQSIFSQLKSGFSRYRALRVGLALALALSLIFGLVGYLWLPGYLKIKAQQALVETLGRPVAIGEISVSPYALSVTVKDFQVGEPEGQDRLLFIPQARVNLSSTSFFVLAPVVQEVSIENPEVSLKRLPNGKLSIADIVTRLATPKAPSPTPLQFAVHNISLTGGRVQFEDQLKKQRHEISELAIGVPFISNFPSDQKTWVAPRLSAKVNGAPFALEGHGSLFSETRQATLKVRLNDLNLAGLESYLDGFAGLKIDKALFGANLELSFIQPPKEKPQVKLTGDAAIQGITARFQPGQSNWQVSLDDLDLSVSAMELQLADLFEKSRIGRVAIPAGTISVKDRSLSGVAPFVATQTQLLVEEIALSGKQPAKLKLEATVNRKGSLQVQGSVAGWQAAPKSLQAELKILAKQIDVIAFQRFATARFPRALLTQGTMSFAGDVALKGTQASVKGDMELANFNVLQRPSNREIMSWKAVQINDINLISEPFDLRVKNIVLDQLTTRLALSEQGELNFATLTEPEKANAAQAPAPATTVVATPERPKASRDLPISIQSLQLRKANIFFTDRFNKPNFRANLSDITGTVGPLKAGTAGAINLQGKVNKAAPLMIAGSVDPFARELFLDMRLSVRDADLPPVSPYTIRHLAYPIERGKLSLDLNYKIKDRALQAQNRLKIDQLTFGPKTESPDALDIPVTLAVALLKNSKGEIDIDLPIGGSLDDPQFSVAGLVWKAFVNLIVKAVTSPFTLLGSLFGEGADLSYIDFPAGSAELSEDSAKVLSGLAKALADRPALRLDVVASVNAAQEKEAILKAKLLRQMKARKLAELASKGQSGGTVAEVTLTEQEELRLLTELYKKADFKKPRNLVGLVKTQPAEEMRARLIEHMTLSDSDIAFLANARSNAVRESLVNQGVATSQIFILTPVASDPEKPQAPSRVNFSLTQ